jgi:hypothetical protein
MVIVCALLVNTTNSSRHESKKCFMNKILVNKKLVPEGEKRT